MHTTTPEPLNVVMHHDFSARTDPGMVRSNNEDSVFVDARWGVAVLADGMGGYLAGEVASAMATSQIGEGMANWLQSQSMITPAATSGALAAVVDQANRAIFDAGLREPQYAGMGTTLVVAVLLGDRMLLGHIGDSRCYRLRKDKLVQLTRDHSFVQEQLDAGALALEDVEMFAYKNLVTRAVGVEEHVELDVQEIVIEDGDQFLLCSDGLSDMVSDPELTELMCTPVPGKRKVQSLIQRANDRGGRDNVSVVLVKSSLRTGRLNLMARLLGK